MTIGAIFKQGRIPSLMALDLLILFFFLCIYFKERPLGWKAISLPIVYAALILTHQTETVLASTFIVGLFIIKKRKEKLKLLLLMPLSILFSSFWLFHFLKATKETDFLQFGFSSWLLNFDSFLWNNLVGIILSITLFILFYIFYKQKQEKEWIYFFAPILLLNFLYLTRLALFIPIIKHIYPDPWMDFIILNLIVIFLSIDWKKYSRKWKSMLMIGLIVLAFLSVAYNLFHTPYMEPYTKHGEEAISLIPYLNQESHFLMFNEDKDGTLYSRALYSYAAIYYNISSASGWFEINKEYGYISTLNSLYLEVYNQENCESLQTLHDQFNMTQVMGNGKYCQILESCGWRINARKGDTCILSYP